MRIASLLPSLTELVCAFGRTNDLVGVTHECDYPRGIETLPHLTRSRIPGAASSGEIDALVSQQAGSLYELQDAALAHLSPDLILTQEQCDVCAVNEATVRRAAARLPGSPRVESVNPTNLTEIFEMFRRIAALLDARECAEEWIARFESTTDEIARRVASDPREGSARAPRRAAVIEWLDPPYSSGHWNPEIIERAGGIEVLGRPGEKSRRVTFADIAASRPEVLLIAPCGFTLERTADEFALIRGRPGWADVLRECDCRVAIIDGSAYFSRPGPRLEATLRIAAAVIYPEVCLDLAPEAGPDWRFLI